VITDAYVTNDVIYRVLENGDADANLTLLTSMFTLPEILSSMNRVQQKFLLDTGITLTRTVLPAEGGKARYDLNPTTLGGNDSIRPRRLTWTDSTGAVKVLTQVDTWELDNGLDDWPSEAGTPVAWYENTLQQQQIGLAPTPGDVGQIGLLYVALSDALDGSGIALDVPDDWTPYIVWGTLAELLSSDGPAFDPVRASYCSQRLEEGVELARLVLGG
jgi:hypothetical protein